MKYPIGILKNIFLFYFSAILLNSCSGPKGYQKIYLNDSEMKLTGKKIEKFESSMHVIREGASGANGGKAGGGCGCN